jgi:hypothetical protein
MRSTRRQRLQDNAQPDGDVPQEFAAAARRNRRGGGQQNLHFGIGERDHGVSARMLHSPRHAASGAETQPRQRVVRKNLNIIAASNDRTGKRDVSPALAWRLAALPKILITPDKMRFDSISEA